jgi:hypothetical protein
MRSPITAGLTLREFCQRFRIGQTKALSLIRRGELIAVNTALTGKPRWVILPEAMAAFEASRVSKTQPAPRRRKRRESVIDFYAD